MDNHSVGQNKRDDMSKKEKKTTGGSGRRFADGETVYVDGRGMLFQARVIGFKNPYGRRLYKIIPVIGSGEAVVEETTLKAARDVKA